MCNACVQNISAVQQLQKVMTSSHSVIADSHPELTCAQTLIACATVACCACICGIPCVSFGFVRARRSAPPKCGMS